MECGDGGTHAGSTNNKCRLTNSPQHEVLKIYQLVLLQHSVQARSVPGMQATVSRTFSFFDCRAAAMRAFRCRSCKCCIRSSRSWCRTSSAFSAPAFLVAGADAGPAAALLLDAAALGVARPAAAGAGPLGVLPRCCTLPGVPAAPPPSLLVRRRAVGVLCAAAAPLAVAPGPLALKQLCPPAAVRAPTASSPGDCVRAESFSLGTGALPLPAPKGLLCGSSAADLVVSSWRDKRSLPSGVAAAARRGADVAAVRGVRGTLLGSESRAVRGVASGRPASPPLLLESRLLDSGTCCRPLLLAWRCCCPPACCCCCWLPVKLDRLSFGILVLDPTAGSGTGLQPAPSCCRPAGGEVPLPMPA